MLRNKAEKSYLQYTNFFFNHIKTFYIKNFIFSFISLKAFAFIINQTKNEL